MYLLSQEGTWQHGNPPSPQNSKDCLPKVNFMLRYPDFFAIQFFNLRSVFDIYFLYPQKKYDKKYTSEYGLLHNSRDPTFSTKIPFVASLATLGTVDFC